MGVEEARRTSDLYKTDLERHLFGFDARSKHPERPITERARALLDQLPELYREVIVLRGRERLPYAEIAERLDLPLGTVKSRLHRARQSLRRLFEEIEDRIESARSDERAPNGT